MKDDILFISEILLIENRLRPLIHVCLFVQSVEAKMSCKRFSSLDKKHRLSVGSYLHDLEKSRRTRGGIALI